MRQISMLLASFEPAIPAGERPQTFALDRAANGIGYGKNLSKQITVYCQALLALRSVNNVFFTITIFH